MREKKKAFGVGAEGERGIWWFHVYFVVENYGK